MRRMGQILLAPPSVKGWDGGAAWLTSASLFERANYALTVSSMRGMHDEPRFDPVAWSRGRKFDSAGDLVDALALEILHSPPTAATREAIVEYLLPEKKPDAKKETDVKKKETDMKGGMEAAKAPPQATAPSQPAFAFDPKALDAKIRGAVRLLLCSPEFQLA
jgi:hypothetical protein